MTWNKDIKFPEKKVDSSWKEEISKSKIPETGTQSMSSQNMSDTAQPGARKPSPQTSRAFLNLISTLGYQALMQLGEIPSPETGQSEVNLEGAQEVINLLIAIKEKTEGNTSADEADVLTRLLSELQMKFAQRA